MKTDEEEHEFYDILYQLADAVIEVKEVNSVDILKQNVFERVDLFVKDLFDKFEERLHSCKDEEAAIFEKEVLFNFLLFSLKRLIVMYDCPDENIKWIAEQVKERILDCTRKNYSEKMEKARCKEWS